jgi:diguanylate cyclase (GGDEF)-like protein/PAS domain S-box-containing protein
MKVIDAVDQGIYFVDRNKIVRFWNKAAELISGYSLTDVIGHSCSDNILCHVDACGTSLCNSQCPLFETITQGIPKEMSLFLHHKNGHRVPVSVRSEPLRDLKGQLIGAVEYFSDTSSRELNAIRIKELECMAMIDPLTQVANRRYIEKELHLRFEEHRRFGVPFGFLFMDIDHFKNFNDTYSHAAGDAVLKLVADTLVKNSRPFDRIGRWGGEKFVAIIQNVNREQLAFLGNRLRVLVQNSFFSLNRKKLHITISIGASVITEEDTIESLLVRTDTLLYESKRMGRNLLTVS